MSIFVESSGDGPDVVVLHGWGLHGGYCRALTRALTDRFRVHQVDLPGHGRSAGVSCPENLALLATDLNNSIGHPAAWIGWSLGALASLQVAIQSPAAVSRLVLISATPKFVQSADWTRGMSQPVFDQFGHGVMEDLPATLNRFLSLQVGPDGAARPLIRELRGELFRYGEPSATTLRQGLAILESADLRSEIEFIRVPTLVIHGANDRIVPPAAGEWLADRIADSNHLPIPGAGHAPLISHASQVSAAVREFLS